MRIARNAGVAAGTGDGTAEAALLNESKIAFSLSGILAATAALAGGSGGVLRASFSTSTSPSGALARAARELEDALELWLGAVTCGTGLRAAVGTGGGTAEAALLGESKSVFLTALAPGSPRAAASVFSKSLAPTCPAAGPKYKYGVAGVAGAAAADVGVDAFAIVSGICSSLPGTRPFQDVGIFGITSSGSGARSALEEAPGFAAAGAKTGADWLTGSGVTSPSSASVHEAGANGHEPSEVSRAALGSSSLPTDLSAAAESLAAGPTPHKTVVAGVSAAAAAPRSGSSPGGARSLKWLSSSELT